MKGKIKFGTLYMGGNAIGPRTRQYNYQSNAEINIGDTISGKEIQWIPVNGILIADHCLLTKISRLDLDNKGLGDNFGKKFVIDGQSVLCRLMRVKQHTVDGSELTQYLNAIEGKDNGNKKSAIRFWTIETSTSGSMGMTWSNKIEMEPAERRDRDLGFLPVLERLVSRDEISEADVGTILTVRIGPSWSMGTLVEVSDYDLVFRDTAGEVVPETGFEQFSKFNEVNRTTVIDRSGIDYISKPFE